MPPAVVWPAYRSEKDLNLYVNNKCPLLEEESRRKRKQEWKIKVVTCPPATADTEKMFEMWADQSF